MKKILIAIAITVLVILILLMSIIVINKHEEDNITNRESENNSNTYNDVTDSLNNNTFNEIIDYNFEETNQLIEEIVFNKVEYANDKKQYFTIKNIVNNYIELIGDNNNEEVIKLISPNYLQEFKVSENTINYNVPIKQNYTQTYYIDIEDMFQVKISDKTTLYIIEGNVSIKYTQDKYPLNIMVELDTVNLLYNIYPSEYLVKYKLNNLSVGDTIQFKETEILNRDNINKYTYANLVTDKEISNKLFDDYIYKLKVDSTDAYKKLNSEYAKRRFNTQEAFNQHIEEIRSIINFAKISQYKVINTSSYTDYICTDQYDNNYIFRQQNGIMNYTVFLDNYTVMLDEDIKYYNELDKIGKAKYNLNKFIKMINTKDYNAIYNVLDNTFKTNNFSNIEKLKEYLQTNMYDINNIELDDYDDDTYEYYVFSCKIVNQKNEIETKEMTVIINQSEGTDFTMSFSFN